MKSYPGAVAIAFSLIILSSCHSFKDPEYKGIYDFKIAKVNGKGSLLYLTIDYFNPNKSGLTLKEVKGDAWIDNNYLGRFSSDTTIHISGNSDFNIPVKLEADTKFVITNIAAMIFNQEVLVKIDGRAKIGKAGVFFHYPIHYEGKQKINGN